MYLPIERFRVVLITLSIFFSVTLALPLASEELCTDAKFLVEASWSEFDEIITERTEPDGEYYFTSFNLPNANECTVSLWLLKSQGSVDYLCQWDFEDDKSGAVQAYRNLRDTLSTCPGFFFFSEEKETERDDEGRVDVTSSRFGYDGNDSPQNIVDEVEIELIEDSHGSAIDFYVKADNKSP